MNEASKSVKNVKTARPQLAVLLIAISALCFAAMPIFAKFAYKEGISVSTLLFLRFISAAVLLFLYGVIKGLILLPDARRLLALFILGFIFYTLQSTCYFTALKYIPVSLTVLILFTYPLIVYIISMIINKERPKVALAVSIGLSLGGMIFIIGAGIGTTQGGAPGDYFKGILLAGAGALIYSLYITMANRVLKDVPALTATCFVSLFAAAGFFVYGSITDTINFSFDMTALIYVAALALFSTVFAILCLFKGLEMLGSTRASILSMLEPIFAITLAYLFLGESITVVKFTGSLAVLAGAAIAGFIKHEVKYLKVPEGNPIWDKVKSK